jgi:hypothetical protein
MKNLFRFIAKKKEKSWLNTPAFLTFLDVLKENEKIVQKLSWSQFQRINTLDQTQVDNILGEKIY